MAIPFWLGAALLAAGVKAAPAAAGDLYPQRSTAPIIVLHPYERQVIPPAEGEFILGSVSDPTAPFSINGTTVAVRPNGAFLAWLPVSPGTFTFLCSLDLKGETTSYARNITVTPPPPPPLPEKPSAIDADSLWPKTDIVLRAGDWLAFRMRASPGHEARCRLAKRPWQDLRESAPGNYEGLQAVLSGEEAGPAAVECQLKGGWSALRAFSRGQATLNSGPPLVAVVKGNAVLRAGAGAGYMAYPLPGTRLVTTGRQNSELRVSLSPTLEGWIDAKDVDLLPAGTPPPRAVVDVIHTYASERGASVRIGLGERVAFTVDQDDEPSSLTLRLYNCVGHTNWIVYDSNDTFVEEVRWKQETTGSVAVRIRLDPAMTLWGWQASYEGASLKLDLRRAPSLAPAPASPLKGLTVVLDPGHNPASAAADTTGPLGTREMDVNFAIAKAVEPLLLKRGAFPVLTRPSNDVEISLVERTRMAVERKGDVFVSIHNNGLTDGVNPQASARGFSIFYYHPHSLPLARHLYRSYEKLVPLPGENLRYGNLMVARLTAMPAALVESAYMHIPEQEEKLNDQAFRDKLAEAIAGGLESFLAEERAKQSRLKPLTRPKGAAAKGPVPAAKPAAIAPKTAGDGAAGKPRVGKNGQKSRQPTAKKSAAPAPAVRKSVRPAPAELPIPQAPDQKRQEAALDEILSGPETKKQGAPAQEKKP